VRLGLNGKRALVRVRLTVQRYWLCRGMCVGRNDHQSLAGRTGRRADVTDRPSYLYALIYMLPRKGEPVCNATSGWSGGPVPLVCAAGWLGLASGESASHLIADEGYAQTKARPFVRRRAQREDTRRPGVHSHRCQHERRITHLPCALQCRRAAVCSCCPPPRPSGCSAAVVPAHLRWGTLSTHSGVLGELPRVL
jgi:hypothetical protein